MKAAGVLALFALALVGPAAQAATLREPNTPITRVVTLLEGLSVETEKDGKKEQELYESFVCWAKSVIDTKTATNAAAEARISELETYIADIDAGRIEFTTERVDLTKELEEIKADIEAATALREKEHSEFLEAEDELTKAIAALDKAIAVLAEATEEHKEGVFLSGMGQTRQTLAERMKDGDALSHAVELGNKLLTAGDAMFLRRILTGDVPTWDWKKLNRKATFKMSYKARSFKIQEVLSKMQKTFTASLADAKAKEAEAQALYDTLMETKKAQEAATTEALEKMEAEMGARGQTKEESQAEVDALKEQVANDTKFIQQTQTSWAEKKEEWKDRQELRAAELKAFSEAISILHNDDARNLMKRSFASQGYAFLQESSSSTRRRESAQEVLRKAAQKSKDSRLGLLAARLNGKAGSHFTEVIKAIDDMIALLKDEENTDLERKETCEKNRADDTRLAIEKSREMDESTELIYKLMAEIAELKTEIEETEEEKKKTEEALAEATRIREDEHAAWVLTDKDDTDAHTTVVAATDVLKNFYADNNLMFVQKKQPVIVAGEAPPPPPTTWDAPYGGKTEQASGIIAILEMLGEDIKSDQAKAKKAEDVAEAAFQTFKTETEASIAALAEEIQRLEGVVAGKEEEIEQETGLRTATKKELASVMATIKDAEPGCDYFTINYPLRLSNRQIEIDGLRKAKAILEGATFDAPDPNREIVPGDAFFMAKRHH